MSTSPTCSDTQRNVTMTYVAYRASTTQSSRIDSLVDRGANGGILGCDARVISFVPGRLVDVEGLAKHQVKDIRICSSGAVVATENFGLVIVIMNQYAHFGKGHTTHSSIQLEHFKNVIDDKSIRSGVSKLLSPVMATVSHSASSMDFLG